MSFLKAARSHVTYANVTATLALVVALTTGTAYAAATVTSADIVNGTVAQVDVAANSLGTRVIKDGGVKAQDLRDGAVGASQVADFTLTNEDVGVLFAQVAADGTLSGSSSAGVTSSKIVGSPGAYFVDFSRDVAACAFVATIGPAGTGSAEGIVDVADRSGNAEAVFVGTADVATGAAADLPFQLIVVC